MSYNHSLTVQSTNSSSNATESRTYGNVRELAYVPINQTAPSWSDQTYASPAAWIDAVARGLIALSNNTFLDSRYKSDWSVTELLVEE